MRTRQTLDFESLLKYALRSLARRPHSAEELRRKLKARAAEAADVTRVFEQVDSYGFLDDRNLAESLARSSLDSQGVGSFKVLAQLRRRQVSADVAKQGVAAVYGETDEAELVRAYLERRLRGQDLSQLLEDPKETKKLYMRLRRAGFGGSTVSQVLRRLSRHPEWLHSLEEAEWGETEEGSGRES